MSDNEHPDVLAFQELEQLIRALGDEMAAWRRRAHEAEAQLRTVQATRSPDTPPATGQVAALQRENDELHTRLESAKQRTEQLLERMRFLRQQHELGAER